ncbi:MAG: FHA domain-containing protein [Planctomycetota bacterium]|jgi:pSer/pThr/pTyr-binding forkhead associated (FHA) protein
MKVKLLSLDRFCPKSRIIVDQLPAMVGRSPEADIHVTDCWASRRHCEIDQLDGTLVVRDIGSRHGTFVNGEQVAQAHLLPGDKLTVGLSSFEVQYKRRAKSSAEHEHTATCQC